MIIVRHELRRGRAPFIVWTSIIGALLAVCILLYSEMKLELAGMQDMFSSMGGFASAFGIDRLNFETLTGYYAMECGNTWGLGGAFYAALCAIGVLSKEEKDKTAEFLLTHPISRVRVITEKLSAVFIQIVMMNIIIFAISLICITVVGENIPWKELILLHLAYFILQIELASICFGISAFMRKGSIGLGLGIAALMYFVNMISNITEKADFLKYITPFAYCDGADIVTSGNLERSLVVIGLAVAVICIFIAYFKYSRKDIH